jgi:rRNA maturation RNase YbeY
VKITVRNLQKKIKVNLAKIKKVACDIKPPVSLNNIELSLYFIENEVIKNLNRQFFEKDSLTDVISFRLSDEYAEVFIAPCVVKSNADSFGVDFEEELFRCTIHGILHIFGYRDKIKKEKIKMWRRQEAILKKVFLDE